MKEYIFITDGEAEFGAFETGDIRSFAPEKVKAHIERNEIMVPVADIEKDDWRRFFARMNVFDLPDNISLPKMRELYGLTYEAVEKGITLPKKINIKKLNELLGRDAPQCVSDDNNEKTEEVN